MTVKYNHFWRSHLETEQKNNQSKINTMARINILRSCKGQMELNFSVMLQMYLDAEDLTIAKANLEEDVKSLYGGRVNPATSFSFALDNRNTVLRIFNKGNNGNTKEWGQLILDKKN